MAKAVKVDVVSLIEELAVVRAEKDVLAKRESAIRKAVLEETGNTATPIADNNGVIIAEIVASVRRSISDWETFEANYPEAYEALAKFTDVLTLTLSK
jgi:hypothetical protein